MAPPQKESLPSLGKARGILIALGVCIADQASKLWALAALTNTFDGQRTGLERLLHSAHPQVTQAVMVSKNFWHFRYMENRGAVWGLLSSTEAAWRTPMFVTLSIAGLFVLGLLYKRSRPTERLLRTALALVFGGALGNLLDRLRLGYVVDFIDWHWFSRFTWPTFNVADAAISVGALWLLAHSLLPNEDADVIRPAGTGSVAD